MVGCNCNPQGVAAPGGRTDTTSRVAAAAADTKGGASSSGSTTSLTVGNASGPSGLCRSVYCFGLGDPQAGPAPAPERLLKYFLYRRGA